MGSENECLALSELIRFYEKNNTFDFKIKYVSIVLRSSLVSSTVTADLNL